MQARCMVMNGMESVIEKKEVHDRSDHVSGVIELGFFIGAHMLEIVEGHHAEHGHLLGNQHVDESSKGITPENNGEIQGKNEKLGEAIEKPLGVLRPELAQIVANGHELKSGAERWVGQQVLEIVLF